MSVETGVPEGSAEIFVCAGAAAQEAKNPQRDMPIGMLGSLAFCTVLYILMSLVMTGLAHYTELNVPHPVDVALAKHVLGVRHVRLVRLEQVHPDE